MGRVNIAALAACILKAEKLHPEIAPTNDKYWHTREACGEIARRMPFGLSAMVMMIHEPGFKDREDLDELAKLYWAEVAHPDILLKEVHET